MLVGKRGKGCLKNLDYFLGDIKSFKQSEANTSLGVIFKIKLPFMKKKFVNVTTYKDDVSHKNKCDTSLCFLLSLK